MSWIIRSSYKYTPQAMLGDGVKHYYMSEEIIDHWWGRWSVCFCSEYIVRLQHCAFFSVMASCINSAPRYLVHIIGGRVGGGTSIGRDNSIRAQCSTQAATLSPFNARRKRLGSTPNTDAVWEWRTNSEPFPETDSNLSATVDRFVTVNNLGGETRDVFLFNLVLTDRHRDRPI